MKGTIAVFMCAIATACVDEPEPVPPPPVPTQDQCPEGFGPLMGLEGGCYKMLAADGWTRGEETCEQFVSLRRSAHLVIVDREAEHVALSALATQGGDIWIGRMQQGSDDEFRNINYIEWAPEYFGTGEPNDYGTNCSGLFCDGGHPGGGDERCIEYKQLTSMWNDKACYRSSRILCEWDNVEPYDWRPGD